MRAGVGQAPPPGLTSSVLRTDDGGQNSSVQTSIRSVSILESHCTLCHVGQCLVYSLSVCGN